MTGSRAPRSRSPATDASSCAANIAQTKCIAESRSFGIRGFRRGATAACGSAHGDGVAACRPVPGVVYRHENAAVGAFSQRYSLRSRPPKSTGWLRIMTEDDQVDVEPLRVGSDLIDGVAARQIAFRGDAARFEPLNRLIQHSLVAPRRIVDDASMSRGSRHQERVVNIARKYQQYVCVRIQKYGKFSASPQSTPTSVRTVVEEKYSLEHRRCSNRRPARIFYSIYPRQRWDIRCHVRFDGATC